MITKLRGVTIDRVDGWPVTLAAYDRIPAGPGSRAARIVCDYDIPPHQYAGVNKSLRQRGQLFTLPVDSSDTSKYSVAKFAQRHKDYAIAAQPEDRIEVNEVNGPWCGPKAATKAAAGLYIAQEHGVGTHLTLYFEGTDVESVWRWLDSHKDVADAKPTSVGFSYYPRQGDGHMGQADWEAAFAELGQRFPASLLNLSEVGDERFDENDEPVPSPPELTRTIMAVYLRTAFVSHPRYEGFAGWWSFVTECARGEFMADLIEGFSR